MAANSWKLRLVPSSKDDIESWLRDEGLVVCAMIRDKDAITIEFNDIDAAFRCRMQFDENIIT